MKAPRKKRNCGCLAVYAVLGLFAVLALINAGQWLGIIAPFTPLPTQTPTAEPLPAVAVTPTPSEVSTVGEWILTPEDSRRAIVAIWAQRLIDANLVTVDAATFPNELYDCVNETVGPSPRTLGIDYLIEDVVATCALLLDQ